MSSSPHPVALFAATASAAAGIIHAAAAGSHADLTTLSRLFAVAALVQVAWAGAVLLNPRRLVVLAGIGINLSVLAAWMVTRATGISAVEGLESAQSVGLQDGLAASFAVVASVTAALSLSEGTLPRLGRVAIAAAVVVAATTVPALTEVHDHTDASHGTELASGDLTGEGGGHAHDDGHAHDAEHRQSDSDSTADLGYPASFATWLDGAETSAARERAERLLVETTEAVQAFPDEAAVQAAGFVSIGDGATGWEHYINIDRIIDPAVLDPADIESIVLRVNPDGTKDVASAMYLLPFGATMDDAPDIAGELTPWHDHQNLCWDGARVVGTTDATGSCTRGEFRATQPMIHVWVVEQPCGPFAGIEGSHGSGCDHGHD